MIGKLFHFVSKDPLDCRVMRDGKLIGVRDTRKVTENDLVAMMVGRKIEDLYGRTLGETEAPVYFRVEDLSRVGVFHDLSFALRKGEILGFSGLVGAGRTEMARAIIGIDRKESGRIFLNDRPIHISSPRDAIDHGIAYLTEDRKGQGLFLSLSIKENVIAPSLHKFTSAIGFLRGGEINDYARKTVNSFSIATPSILQKVRNLSGGNQQKVMVAEWIGIQPQVLICDEPTRGVDVGAKAEIYRILRELASTGTGIIMISSDLPELIGMCDRILVMHDGEISGEVRRKDFSEERILFYAAGLSDAHHKLGASHSSQEGN